MDLQQLINDVLSIMGQFGIPPQHLQTPEGSGMIIRVLLEQKQRGEQHKEVCELLEQIREALHRR